MRELLGHLLEALESGRDCVYCSVVETRGSTPQKAGAAMLVFADGSQRGTLGGGCVEAEVKQRALRGLSDPGGHAEVMAFCLDDNYGWDDGLICGGRMTILADPFATAAGDGKRRRAAEYYGVFRRLVDSGRGCTEAVAIADKGAGFAVGSRYLFDHEKQVIGQLADSAAPEKAIDGVAAVRDRPGPAVHQDFAFLPILPRITVFIVGGGHVGQAVAKIAKEVDFDVWVLDDRAEYASAERFPSALRRVVGDIGQSLRQMADAEIDPSVYALIVTRGHSHDEEALYHLASTRAGYVGMIGSKRKIKMIFEDLLARGISGEALQRVHAPLGFAIGSQTVPEIAISIVAELIACRNLGATIPAARKSVSV